MAGLLIFILLSFALFYYLTRIVWVRIIKGEEFIIELHLPIFAVYLIKRKDKGDNNKKSKKYRPSILGYIRIITRVLSRINTSRIIIKNIIIPIKTDDFNKTSMLRPIRQHALICSFIAYLRTKVNSLTLENNAINLSPDIKSPHFYLTIKLRLYQLIYGLLSIRHSVNKESKRTKGRNKYVRE